MKEWIFRRPDGFASEAEHDEYCVGELIRCKDCKWQHSDGDGHGWCDRAIDNGDGMSCVIADDENYCSHGERREDGEV